jgi:outer membrane protein TolC
MEKLKQITLLLMLVVFALQANAQTDSVYQFTLKQAQDFAIEHFFTSKNAKLDIEIAKKKIWETTAIGLPQVSGSFDYQHIPNPPTMDFGGQEIKLALENSSSYGATVSQLVFSGEYIVGLQASKTYRTFAEENYEKVKIDLLESVASNYFAVIIIRNNRKILVETYENLLVNLDQMKKMFEQGFIEDTDLDQIDLVVKRTNNSILSVDRQLEYLEKLFKYQLGLTSEDQVELMQTMDELVLSHLIWKKILTINY